MFTTFLRFQQSSTNIVMPTNHGEICYAFSRPRYILNSSNQPALLRTFPQTEVVGAGMVKLQRIRLAIGRKLTGGEISIRATLLPSHPRRSCMASTLLQTRHRCAQLRHGLLRPSPR